MIGCDCSVCKSSDERDKRYRSSAYVEYGGLRILVDAGPDFRSQMLRAGIRHLDAILLTHNHKDHTGGLDDVRAFNYIERAPIRIFCEKYVEESLRREYSYAFAEHRYPGVPEWRKICETEAFLWKIIGRLPLPSGARLAEFTSLAGRYGRLLGFIRENLSARLDIDCLAEAAGLSRGRLSRNFSRDFSMPLKSFLQKELVAQASRYLLGSTLSVREISERLHFSSEYYFSNFFRRCTGTSPTCFRRENPGAQTLFPVVAAADCRQEPSPGAFP